MPTIRFYSHSLNQELKNSNSVLDIVCNVYQLAEINKTKGDNSKGEQSYIMFFFLFF